MGIPNQIEDRPDIQLNFELADAALSALTTKVNGNLDATNLKDGAVTSVKTGQFAGFSVYRAANVSYVSGSVVLFDTNDVAPRGCSLSAGRITFTEAGVYVVAAKVEFATTFAVNHHSYLELWKQTPLIANTLTRRGAQYTSTGQAVAPMIGLSAIMPLGVGDIIEIHAPFSVAGPITMSGGLASTSFSAFKVGAV